MGWREAGQRLGDVAVGIGQMYPRWAMQQKQFAYQQDRDKVGDQRWQTGFDYRKDRDMIGDQQWGQQFNEGVRRFDLGYGLDERQFGENVRQFDTRMAQDESQFSRRLGQDQSQFDARLGATQSGGGDNSIFGMTPYQWMRVGEDWRKANVARLEDEAVTPTIGPLQDAPNPKADSLAMFQNMPNFEAGQRYLGQLTGQQPIQQGPTWTNNLSVAGEQQQSIEGMRMRLRQGYPDFDQLSPDEQNELIRLELSLGS